LPSERAITEQANRLAVYAAAAQSQGLVPILEPEVLVDGTHTLERSARVHRRVITAMYAACERHHVLLEGTLIKPSMVRPGRSLPRATAEEVGRATLVTLQRTVRTREGVLLCMTCVFLQAGPSSRSWSDVLIRGVRPSGRVGVCKK
jgi:fructose-bisphosphate aldolase, class I